MAEKGENIQPQGILEPVLPNINEWPIYKLTQELDTFIPQWVENTKKRIIDNAVKSQMPLEEIIAKAAYLETIRLRTKPLAH
ncbi:MAG: hypothetical protein IPL35_04180 [Sphingobacteriales bacterium]|nr:hypothetical protein [Sphingobacteriales bacterium]